MIYQAQNDLIQSVIPDLTNPKTTKGAIKDISNETQHTPKGVRHTKNPKNPRQSAESVKIRDSDEKNPDSDNLPI